MREYFYQRFPRQLARIEFHRPNEIVLEQIMRDDSVVFFGGQDWSNASEDLELIPVDDRSKFILSLFMIVLTDQALYTYYRDSYFTWRAQTNYPKFGWSGFGPHNENPLKLLWAPERDELIDVAQTLSLVPEFVSFLIDDTCHFFEKNISRIETTAYFDKISHDAGFTFNQGRIVPAVKASIVALTRR